MSGRAAVWDTYFLYRFEGEKAPESVDLPIDFWDFENEPKLGPAVLYRRQLPTETDPISYFSGNESSALIARSQVELDPSSVTPMDDAEFWSIAKTTRLVSWPHRIDEVVHSLRTRSVSEVLAFHRTLESKISELEHPLRAVLIGNGEIEADATGAAMAAIILDGPAAFTYHVTHLERFEEVEGITEADILHISSRALKEGHGIEARIAVGSELSHQATLTLAGDELTPTADDIEQEQAYREIVHGFRDPVWDSGDVGEWLAARALVQVDAEVVEIVVLVARMAKEERSQVINRVLDRLVVEGSLLAGLEVAAPLFSRPGLRSSPIFEIVTPKTRTLDEYLTEAGYPMLRSASLSVDKVHPRWALVGQNSESELGGRSSS